jgi:hypothetical protein
MRNSFKNFSRGRSSAKKSSSVHQECSLENAEIGGISTAEIRSAASGGSRWGQLAFTTDGVSQIGSLASEPGRAGLSWSG